MVLFAGTFFFAYPTFAAVCTNVIDLDAYTDSQLQEIFDACTKDIENQKKELQSQQQKTQSISKDLATINT